MIGFANRALHHSKPCAQLLYSERASVSRCLRQISMLASRYEKSRSGAVFCKNLRWKTFGSGAQLRSFMNWSGKTAKPKSQGRGLGMHDARKLLKELWSQMSKNRRRTIASSSVIVVSLMLGSKVINVLVPLQFKKLVDHLNEEVGLNVGTEKAAMITGALTILLGYYASRVLANATQELRNAIFAKADQSFIRHLGRWFFKHLHNLDHSFHTQRKLGAIQRARDRGTRGISNIVRALVQNIIPTIFEFLLVGGLLYMKCGWQYTAVVAACVGGYSWFTVFVTKRRNEIRRIQNKRETEENNHLSDSLVNHETIKLFTNEGFEAAAYDERLKKVEKATLTTMYTLAGLNFGQNLIISTGLLAVMHLACGDIAAGVLTVGDLVMVNQLLFQLSVPLNFLGTFWRELSTATIDLQDLNNLLQRQPQIKIIADAPNIHIPELTAPNIVFDDVKFHYVNEKPILNGVSLEVPAGKKIAIVGGSGSGKSTLIRLLYRFYDPTQGRILVNGQDITEVELYSLRRAIGVVPQDTVLFHKDVFYNIQYGKKDATEEEVYEKAKMAEIHETIMKFPKTYQTQVGERGLQLSGGEKQRIAIARVLLKDPPIFIYDEATSSLDSITEDKIMTALRRVTENRTTVVIAHRLSTVMEADEINVIEDGKIVERGRHSTLIMDQSSLYYDMWMRQSEAFRDNYKTDSEIDNPSNANDDKNS